MNTSRQICFPETSSSFVNRDPWREEEFGLHPAERCLGTSNHLQFDRKWSMTLNEVDPGMNGDVGGWQAQGQPGGGNRGHHMGGGRRMHNQQQNRIPGQHHGPPAHRMVQNFRQQQQPQQQQSPFMYMGNMPDMMDMNMMRLNDLSLNSGPPSQVMSQQSGMYGDVQTPQSQWGQPQPFAPPEDIYDPNAPHFGAPPAQHAMHNGPPPFGNTGPGRGGYNRSMQQNNRQGGGGGMYRAPQGGYPPMPMPLPHQLPPQQGGPGQQFFTPPQQFGAPFPGQQMQAPESLGSSIGGNNAPGGQGFSISSTTMDDYSMWTDENDEETKKKKILRDKGLLAWGDPETSNNKIIRKWIIPEGQEEDLDTAMSRSTQYQKKKLVHEESIKRRLNSDNPQIVAQAQQQMEEEKNAMIKVGKSDIVPTGWGDEEKGSLEFDQSHMAKAWDDAIPINNGKNNQGGQMSWNMPGQQALSNETRNPFFAQHMQQHQSHGGPPGNHGMFMNNGAGDGVWSHSGGLMDGTGSGNGQMMNMVAVGGNEPMDEHRMKVADNLRYAVEKGYLDIGLLTLTHIPPKVLDLLTLILTKIPVLDEYEAENLALENSVRPSDATPDEDALKYMNETQRMEHDKIMINIVTAKIEVTELSKKINRALIDSGLMAPSQLDQVEARETSQVVIPTSQVNAVSQSVKNHSVVDASEGNPDDAPPVQCDYYDYSFLG